MQQRLSDAQDVIPIRLDYKGWQAAYSGDGIAKVVISDAIQNITLCFKVFGDTNKVLIWRGRVSNFFLPMIVAKVIRKKNILLLESIGHELAHKQHGKTASRIYKRIEKWAANSTTAIASTVPDLTKHPFLKGRKIFKQPLIPYYIKKGFNITKPYQKRGQNIAYIGRLTKEKGIKDLPKIIKDSHNDTRFIIVGTGPLENKVAQSKNHHSVNMMGHIPHKQIPTILNESKCLLLLSDYEGLPRVAIEAMACGTPVVSTAVGAMPSLLANGRGILTEKKQYDVDMVMIADLELAKISKRAHDWVHQNYSYAIMRKRWTELIKEIGN